ncbi:hypothetical protein CPB84DRAFT_1687940 [Gymnopilus junonius]|uniref:DUF6534 domain-containing protein n=1 Tax=Gymnopilus junonius TaxID=109634 RepID=A0A9P5THU7_GYMJU|nr:hypothetical protein CPB84DRAFT_1687940 [Gymnopilus junonius]
MDGADYTAVRPIIQFSNDTIYVVHPVSIVQAWYYFSHQQDPWSLKGLVSAVMIFDTIHQSLITHTVYTYTITNWGNADELGVIVWSMLVSFLQGLTAFLVQSFLTMRVWRLSNRRKILTGSVVRLNFGSYLTRLITDWLHLKTYAELTELKYLSILVNTLAAAGDALIAATLCILLHRSRTGFRKSDTIINKLILFAVNTGFLTSLCAVASLVSIVVAGNTFLYIAFFFCIGRLYTNSLLASLNARKMIRRSGEAIHTTSDNISLSLRDFPNYGEITSRVQIFNVDRQHPTNLPIKIDTTKEFTAGLDNENDRDLEKAEVRAGFSRQESVRGG